MPAPTLARHPGLHQRRAASLNAPGSFTHSHNASGHALGIRMMTAQTDLLCFSSVCILSALSLRIISVGWESLVLFFAHVSEPQANASQHGRAVASLVSHHPPLRHHRDALQRRSEQVARHIGSEPLLYSEPSDQEILVSTRVSASAFFAQTEQPPWSAPENQHLCREAAKSMDPLLTKL